MKHRLIMLATGLLLLSTTSIAQPKVYQNLKLSDEKRVENLLNQLTLDEKIDYLSTDLGVKRLGIPSYGHYEGLHGLTLGGPGRWGKRIKNPDGSEGQIEYPTTIFPQSYGLGETWDPDLIRRIGELEGTEARYYSQAANQDVQKALVLRAPNADLARDPRWGRTEESFGEDPFLTATMSTAMVRGLQGDHPRYWRSAALLKHFLANSNEDGRDSTSSNFDEQLFREYYSYPFYKAITEGGSRAFMASYNGWNGITMCVNPILESITRKDWGNNGIICTDGGAFKLLVEAHHAYKTMEEGAAAIVKATTGQFLDDYRTAIKGALSQGLLTEKDIDKAIRGNIFVALKLGLLDGKDSRNPYLAIGRDTLDTAPFHTQEAKALAREAMGKSVVLLKNDNSTRLLPLDLNRFKKIALIGPYTNEIVQDWYSGKPPYEVTIYDGLKSALRGSGVEIKMAKDNKMGQAEQLAKWADVVIACYGNHPYGHKTDWKFCPVPSDGREAVDRQTMNLPEEEVLKLLHQANPNTILVLVSSFPYTINWSNEHLPAIVHITHCAQEQGNGLADVLLGKVNPAGRLTQTWVRSITDLPEMMDYDIRHGRTYMYSQRPVLYPFGYGLSYSKFEYQAVKTISTDKKDEIRVVVNVKNDSQRDGEEVVQLYVAYPDSHFSNPQKQLKAFKRVMIKAGQTIPVELTVKKTDLRRWDTKARQWVYVPGKTGILLGSSSADIRLSTSLDISAGGIIKAAQK